jgi:aminoglycoside 6'-N-acetyltransferase
MGVCMNQKTYENYIILLIGFAGTGKRTVGEALASETHFRFSHQHSWYDPILNLLGEDYKVWWEINEKGWEKLNAVRDVIFSTITDVCSPSSNFIISHEMIDKDPYHKILYNKVLDMVEKRHAHFLPIRLICEENELVKRVQAEDRKKYFKNRDAEFIRKRRHEHEVFRTNHPHEITIDTTHKSPDEVVKIIIEKLNSL